MRALVDRVNRDRGLGAGHPRSWYVWIRECLCERTTGLGGDHVGTVIKSTDRKGKQWADSW